MTSLFSKIIQKSRPIKISRPPYAEEFVCIFSHPRSGTHFSEAFVGENFYPNEETSIKLVEWGHWKNRETHSRGNPYGKLFGSHQFPSSDIKNINYPAIYIYRDGRAVAYSIWKTRNFVHPSLKDLSFSEFLKTKLDWIGSPAFRSKPKMTIAQHWRKHVDGWLANSQGNHNILCFSYEDLYQSPYLIAEKIKERFFSNMAISEVKKINAPVGLLPNAAKQDSWKEHFNKKDLEQFNKEIQRSKFLWELYREK